MLTKADRARLERLIDRLSDDKKRCDTSAETELLDWSLHHKGVFEALKKRKHDTHVSAETRTQLQNIVIVTRVRKNDQLE